ncbi:MAG: hypothetical protein ABIT23_10945 [Nitrosospira sp.]
MREWQFGNKTFVVAARVIVFVRGPEEPYPDIEYGIRAWKNPAIATFDGGVKDKH